MLGIEKADNRSTLWLDRAGAAKVDRSGNLAQDRLAQRKLVLSGCGAHAKAPKTGAKSFVASTAIIQKRNSDSLDTDR